MFEETAACCYVSIIENEHKLLRELHEYKCEMAKHRDWHRFDHFCKRRRVKDLLKNTVHPLPPPLENNQIFLVEGDSYSDVPDLIGIIDGDGETESEGSESISEEDEGTGDRQYSTTHGTTCCHHRLPAANSGIDGDDDDM